MGGKTSKNSYTTNSIAPVEEEHVEPTPLHQKRKLEVSHSTLQMFTQSNQVSLPEGTKLLATPQHYISVFQNLLDGIITTNEQGITLHANQSMCTMTGWSAEELVGQNCTIVIPEKARAAHIKGMERFNQTRKGKMVNLKHAVETGTLMKNGDIMATDLSFAMSEAEGGIIYTAFFRDVRKRKETENIIKQEKEKSDFLLMSIYPTSIVARLKNDEPDISDNYDDVTIAFIDLVGFTSRSSTMAPKDLVKFLKRIFDAMDEVAERYQLEKIKTIGDCYMVAAGVPEKREDHAEAMAHFALEVREAIEKLNATLEADIPQVRIRTGINTGKVVAGIIGSKRSHFDIWGDAVNVASRMESSGEPGKIQISCSTHELVKEKFVCEARGVIAVKGKGEVETFFLLSKKD